MRKPKEEQDEQEGLTEFIIGQHDSGTDGFVKDSFE